MSALQKKQQQAKVQIQDSSIQGFEAMTVKHLKNLYSNGKDCNSIDAFVPYIEKQRA